MLLGTRTVRSSSELSELSGCRPGCLGAVRLVWVVFGLFGHVRTLPPLSGWCLDNVCPLSGFWVKNKTPAFELFELFKTFNGSVWFLSGVSGRCLVGV